MFKITSGKTYGLKDVEKVIDLVNTLSEYPFRQARSLFKPGKDIVVARAPGRLDVMGGIADYSGSLVLQLPLKEATVSAVQPSPGNSIRIISLSKGEPEKSRHFEMRLDDFFADSRLIDYPSVRRYFSDDESTAWAAYIAGVFPVLMREKNASFPHGASILISSDVPEGKGVSSSAALEVATMTAVSKVFGIEIEAIELATLCQKVENLVVGAPCGIMDQMASALGVENQLLALVCQPAQLKPFIQIPDDITFWGIDSGIRHSVSGSDYTSVRIGAFMGQRIISEIIEKENHIEVQGNYLSNISPYEFEKYFVNHLPQTMNGGEFIRKYQNTFDTITIVDPDLDYSVFNPTAHPIYDNYRINIFRELLDKQMTEEICTSLGEQMYLSHESYSACGLNSSGTDRLVELTIEVGRGKGLYGAKITGGGSGGTVAVLSEKNKGHLIEGIITRYSEETGHRPYLFAGSSMGAIEFGTILLRDV